MPRERPPLLEPPDVDVASTLRFALGFFAFVAVSIALLGMYYRLGFEHPRLAMTQFPAPRLETREAEERTAIASSHRGDGAYAWVDRAHGLVRIPVARAMEILVGRGAHAFDPSPSAAAAGGSP